MNSVPRVAKASATPAARELRLPPSRRPVPTGTRLHTRRIPVLVYVLVLLLLPTVAVTGSMAVGWWATSGTGTGAGTGERAGSGTGSVDEPAEPADVKGSMTVQQVVNAFPSVTATQILARFGAPAGTPADTQLKDLVGIGNGTEIPEFRTWLETELG